MRMNAASGPVRGTATRRVTGRAAPTPPGRDDSRFRNLLTRDAWQSLPWPIQRRFSHALADGETTVFVGAVAYTRMSLFGFFLSQLLRLVGAPLPLWPSGRVAATVVVTEDAASGGQLWTRIYGRAGA